MTAEIEFCCKLLLETFFARDWGANNTETGHLLKGLHLIPSHQTRCHIGAQECLLLENLWLRSCWLCILIASRNFSFPKSPSRTIVADSPWTIAIRPLCSIYLHPCTLFNVQYLLTQELQPLLSLPNRLCF